MNENIVKKQFGDLTVSTLKDICRNNEISGYSSLKKSKVIDLIISSLEEELLKKVMEKYGILPEKVIPDKKVKEIINTGREIDERTYLSYLLQSLTKKELTQICKDYSIRGYSKYTKQDLIEFILDSLAEEEYRLIIYEKELEIISSEIDTAIRKIQASKEEREYLSSVRVTNQEMHDVELSFTGMNWTTHSFVSIRQDNLENPMRDCDCRVGANMGFCNHFWVGFIFSLKQNWFNLKDWTLTKIPEDLEESIKPIKITSLTPQDSKDSQPAGPLKMIDQSTDSSELLKYIDKRITVDEAEVINIEEKQSEFQEIITTYYLVTLKNIQFGLQKRKKGEKGEEELDELLIRVSDNAYLKSNLKVGDKITLNGGVVKDNFLRTYMLKRVTKLKKL